MTMTWHVLQIVQDHWLFPCIRYSDSYYLLLSTGEGWRQESEVSCPPDEDCKPNKLDGDLESMDNDSYKSNEEFDYGYAQCVSNDEWEEVNDGEAPLNIAVYDVLPMEITHAGWYIFHLGGLISMTLSQGHSIHPYSTYFQDMLGICLLIWCTPQYCNLWNRGRSSWWNHCLPS